jgi:outer membrane scaffolding protein for murein synthesis (MipA/OmpV family)
MPTARLATFVLPAVCAALVSVPVQAQDGRPAEDGGKYGADRVTIGFGGGIAPDYSGSDDYEFQPGGIVQGTVSGFNFAMRGTNLYVDLAREQRGAEIDIIAGPVMQVRLERNGTVKDARVGALGKRSAAFEAGGYIGVGKRGVLSRFDEVSADVTLVHDVGNVHKSYLIRPSIGYQTLIGKRTFTQLRASADIVGKGFARTYYDVPAGSVLPAYATNGGGLESVGLTALATHGLGRDPRRGWSLFALGGWSRITGKFARSPIVSVAGDADQFRLIGGLGYTF